jgi:hypothetical protein
MRVVAWLWLVGCAGTDPADSDLADSDADSDVVGDTDADVVLPQGVAALLPWLEAGTYRDWPSEAAVHPSTGPHFGGVRTFLNPTLDASLRAEADVHPVGAATVKELYGDGDEVRGWAVMLKVGAGSTGADWYWMEWYAGQTYADAAGAGLCVGCHAAGRDHVLTPWP